MIRWSMDTDVFGYPDYGYKVQTSREFTPKLGDKGRGRYIDYNPTAPMAVSAVFGWRGYQLAAFREAWEDPARLNFGANWFGMTVPVYFSRLAAGEYPTHFQAPFSTSLAGHDWWKVSMSLDIDPSPQLVTA